MSKTLRLFYALMPDDVCRSALTRLQFDLPGAKTRYRNFHVTLAFLGEQDAALLPRLQQALERVQGNYFEMQIDKRGHFAKPRVAWAGCRHEPQTLKEMQAALVADLRQMGVAFADHALFKPHVTLARDVDQPPPPLDFPPIIWHAKQVVLVQSVQAEDGLRYDVLASHWLKKN
ncbi:RNA 2',3'-cyclic phosphodiesterase [Massilia sp. W12]|uniref:RNA 2',3'-cyclic phosphodiesterase n=1 Tax=Massilia sp. W12 TaxID=3126507 RepID=UPI0030CACD8B